MARAAETDAMAAWILFPANPYLHHPWAEAETGRDLAPEIRTYLARRVRDYQSDHAKDRPNSANEAWIHEALSHDPRDSEYIADASMAASFVDDEIARVQASDDDRVITQIFLLIAIAAMSLHDPRLGLQMLAVNAIAIAFFSASQDISLDAYRTDVLQDREMGAGAAVFVMGYRVALLVTGGLALYLADSISWPTVYLLLASLMLIGIVATFLAPEPVLRELPPRTIGEAVILPFREFFQRAGVGRAFLVLLFIVLYKYSDSLAGSMTTPFLLKTGFSQKEVGAVFGGAGLIATIVGTLAGGAGIGKWGINQSLWIFVVFQGLSNLTYYALALSSEPRLHDDGGRSGKFRTRPGHGGDDGVPDEHVRQAIYSDAVRASLESHGGQPRRARRPRRKNRRVAGLAVVLPDHGGDGDPTAPAVAVHRALVARCPHRRSTAHRRDCAG